MRSRGEGGPSRPLPRISYLMAITTPLWPKKSPTARTTGTALPDGAVAGTLALITSIPPVRLALTTNASTPPIFIETGRIGTGVGPSICPSMPGGMVCPAPVA